MAVYFERQRDRDRVVARCLLGSGTSLAALTLEAANPLLPPVHRISMGLSSTRQNLTYHFALIFENCELLMVSLSWRDGKLDRGSCSEFSRRHCHVERGNEHRLELDKQELTCQI